MTRASPPQCHHWKCAPWKKGSGTTPRANAVNCARHWKSTTRKSSNECRILALLHEYDGPLLQLRNKRGHQFVGGFPSFCIQLCVTKRHVRLQAFELGAEPMPTRGAAETGDRKRTRL